MKDIKDKNLNDLNEEEAIEEEILNEETEEVEDELILKDKEISEVKDQLLRLQADFMNFRRRADKEKANAISYGLESFACDILPAIDNFQRALDSEEEKG